MVSDPNVDAPEPDDHTAFMVRRQEAERRKSGVELPAQVLEDFQAWCERMGRTQTRAMMVAIMLLPRLPEELLGACFREDWESVKSWLGRAEGLILLERAQKLGLGCSAQPPGATPSVAKRKGA